MLIVGLGNPDDKYKSTRHNIGFMIIDALLNKLRISDKKSGFSGIISSSSLNGKVVYFLKPLTYMNRSGISVREVANYYKISTEDILVIHDELNLPFGKIKFRRDGSAGGHNGISSIISELGSQEFKRLKFGIDRVIGIDVANYVLSHFNSDEKKILGCCIDTAVDAIEVCINEGIQNAMNLFNTK